MPTLSRRHPAAIALLLLLGLFVTGTAYSAVAPKEATASVASADSVANGKKLFVANCATCHGANGLGIDQAGPSLAGVGAASVDFQMGTGRMPMTEPGVQAKDDLQVKFTDEEISDIAAYVATLGPGPSVPDEEYTDGSKGDPGKGGQIFRVNCAMCHNSAGAGGALTRGKDAPSVQGVSGKHIYEAMETGPQSMPVFNDANLSPESKRDVIAYLEAQQEAGNPGGNPLGSLGPVPEGLFIWTIGLGLLVGFAVWLGQKSA
ncbi:MULTISPECIES: cytochrome bc1 complex diheme cytochrome c subunit [Janibacter]|uniref:Cytochrome bc1 complex cytochrome c subunit n=1 Tax=Janibacter hoylei PVAS-1 TaxID=1210046 RepID=K1EKV9_9MICO|nr:c-type cytochrome [Janibacter hoylei]EKA59963.1 cytochrome bc1 complex cytochrome c1 subunit [Janibacter hoylei PVAS-1]MCT1619150.1 c-type cytochrome [Janibacter hoylei]MCT2291574.1 c-type cytochrome [Janibacter hoylei]RWU83795.1 cystathionine beta-lyase [Janibacter hoylei PVAS-1]